jgi:acyl-CoA synthetase (AMP-forming)/AMP-acid ligase II
MPSESKENVRALLEKQAGAAPAKTFLFSETDGRQWTYAEFDRAVNQTANMLVSKGIGKGDVVSLLLPNSAEYVIAYFACWKIGALAGPVNSLLKKEEIQWVVENSEAKLMLVGGEFLSSVESNERVDRHRSVPSALADGSPDCTFRNVVCAPELCVTTDPRSAFRNSPSPDPPANAGGTDLLVPLPTRKSLISGAAKYSSLFSITLRENSENNLCGSAALASCPMNSVPHSNGRTTRLSFSIAK